ncbi:class I SAM-dependent methyltransferase [Desulfobulbus rhabdoformis]|uniref:class I SAM-dependent methyltransferase n=1 Tax=Desulfobulbus rhabdoformis TaxID=34032 RepID=UPI001965FD5B|nr:class I SAM-dependent methyltransferase [Desulfobulbus rhabdoformis]MBM9616978.1 class I SAM-dependent methyltransferase [Desulfobulbus rhabdoformis]
MIDSARKELFDNWALQYDEAVSNSTGQYPFDGYDNVLSALVRLAEPRPELMVLDFRTGTGNLAGRFAIQGCTVWGLDFSKTMLEKTSIKFPKINLVHADLLGEWPQTLPTTFDLVVSAYVLHEFDTTNKVRLISRVAEKYLKPGGRILIADIAFPNESARVAAARRWRDNWDDTEHYWVAEEVLEVIENT